MAYKDILVRLDTPQARSRYAVAAKLAARSGGTVSGVFLKTTLINQYNDLESIGYLPGQDLQALIEENDQAQDEAAEKAATALQAAATEVGAACDWQSISGDTLDDLVAAARRADLTILAPPVSSEAFNVHASPVNVALECGGPVLIVPEGPIAELGQRVLLAWSGSRESARALRDALPLLAPGAVIEIRTVKAHPDDEAAADTVVDHLRRLGFKPHLQTIIAEDHAVTETLRREAARCDCDLIVLGLYGHTRLREFVLGGVSREALKAPSLPLLLSH
jgi:nucleotide-binding universal stress UspA family protein